MKKFLITFFALIIGCSTFAQDSISTDAKLEYNRGVDLYKIGQYDRSMSSFRRAIELDPNYIDAYYNLGSILEYLNQEDAALAVFKQIIVRKPEDYESVYKAANLSNKLGQPDKARTYLALIPPESTVYTKAQQLASLLGTDMQTLKAALKPQDNSELDLTNGIYNNIPSPTGITADNFGNIYVACFSDNMIYKITPDGRRIIFLKDSRINGPIALVSDSVGNIYISNYNSDNVLKVTSSGSISVLISNISKPYGLFISKGLLYVSSQGSNSVLRYKL